MREIGPILITININGVEFSNQKDALISLDEFGHQVSNSEFFDFSKKKILEMLNRETGFARVVFKKSQVLIAVDRVRVYPLYYSIINSILLISDNASWIRSKIANPEFDNEALSDFYQAGFVPGSNTLYKDIKTVQAGEYIYFELREKKWNIEKTNYFSYFVAKKDKKHDHSDLDKKLDNILYDVFSDIKERHKNKTIVVPLSGGFDSRLIIHWLKRLEFKNVFCYTFGTPGNLDCIKAIEIAKKLNYPIEFIHLTAKLWHQAYKSKQYQEFKKNYSGYCSLMSSQEFPAFYYLVKNNIIPENSVILPGHTGDFISGGHIPNDIAKYGKNLDSVVNYVFHKHFSLWKTINFPHRKTDYAKIIDKIRLQLAPFVFNSKEDVASGIEYYDWLERQGKFIVQFVCVYRFYDQSFELPLWSCKLIDFFLKIPLELKLNRKLYLNYLGKYDQFDIFQDARILQDRPEVERTHFRTKICKIKRIVYNDLFYKQFITYFKDDLNFYSTISYLRLVFSFGLYRNPNSFLVEDYIKDLKAGRF